ncbi:hypothetical protein QCE47_26310 [Caballeronia sp. LZ025]|uniref:hypothetical protein n=1 Tax=Caballeronia TaxID=1827195 RepID=UPI001FD38EF5|nr:MULTISPECIES: hypothetical protein [Caballeronia]MDR5735838.1 hypothetical protein [Caballeronia sp. LZ025]
MAARPSTTTESDPTKKVAWLVEHVKTPKNLQEYGLMRIGSRIKLYGAVSEGVLTVVDAICKYATWQQAISDEASALKFQKTWTLDARATLCDGLFLGALASGAGNVLKMYGAWRNAYAVGMPEMLAGEKQMERAAVFLKFAGVLGGILAGVYAVMDLADGNQSREQYQWQLMTLQGLSGATGAASAVIAIWATPAAEGGATVVGSISILGATFAITLTIIGFVLAAILAALALWISNVKGDNIAQWLTAVIGEVLKRRDTLTSMMSSPTSKNYWLERKGHEGAQPQDLSKGTAHLRAGSRMVPSH